MLIVWCMMMVASGASAHGLDPTRHPAWRPVPSARHGAEAAPVAPAEMLERLDRFRAGLSPSDRRRLDRALPRAIDGGIARCDRAEGSRASCEAAAYLPALRSTGLLHRFRATHAAGRSTNG